MKAIGVHLLYRVLDTPSLVFNTVSGDDDSGSVLAVKAVDQNAMTFKEPKSSLVDNGENVFSGGCEEI